MGRRQGTKIQRRMPLDIRSHGEASKSQKNLKRSRDDPLIKLTDSLYAAMKRKNDKFRKEHKYTKGMMLAEEAYGNIKFQSERRNASRLNVDKLCVRAHNIARDLSKIAEEIKDSEDQVVESSLGMANAILDGEVYEDISRKKKEATSSLDDGSVSNKQRRAKKNRVESDDSGEDV